MAGSRAAGDEPKLQQDYMTEDELKWYLINTISLFLLDQACSTARLCMIQLIMFWQTTQNIDSFFFLLACCVNTQTRSSPPFFCMRFPKDYCAHGNMKTDTWFSCIWLRCCTTPSPSKQPRRQPLTRRTAFTQLHSPRWNHYWENHSLLYRSQSKLLVQLKGVKGHKCVWSIIWWETRCEEAAQLSC